MKAKSTSKRMALKGSDLIAENCSPVVNWVWREKELMEDQGCLVERASYSQANRKPLGLNT